jgi:hypothetical protein
VKITGGKLRKAIIKLLIKTFRPDYNKVTKNIKEGIIVTITKEQISLNCA